MAITALDIQQQSFGTSRHGYDPQEVDIFLEKIASEIDNYNRALLEAKGRYEAAEARAQAAEFRASAAAAAPPVAPPAPVVKTVVASTVSEDQISRAFIAAQKSADAMKEEARAEAEKTYREAEKRGRDIVRDAMAEKAHILDEVDRLRESCEKFRSEYLSLLNHFAADAKKVMPVIEAAVPDIAVSKASKPEAPDFTSQYNAAYAPPQPVVAESVYVASAAAAATVVMPVVEESYVEEVYVDEDVFDAPEERRDVQGIIDFDDELDIEEID
ncbi:MAG: DivIVA domain-containing protein [Coriobacteriia bacterium]|nr:DivIVA domain-containing protein [Coriobacteriia bacterium]